MHHATNELKLEGHSYIQWRSVLSEGTSCFLNCSILLTDPERDVWEHIVVTQTDRVLIGPAKDGHDMTSRFNPAHCDSMCLWWVVYVNKKRRKIWTKCFLLILNHQKALWWGLFCSWSRANVSVKEHSQGQHWSGRKALSKGSGFGSSIIILRLSSRPSTSEGATKTENPKPLFPLK